MRAAQSRWAWVLLAPLALFWGCGAPALPPGGRPAVEYWHRVLAEHPDLPAKVRAIVEDRGVAPITLDQIPSSEVRIYTDTGEVAFNGSRIEIIVTDLDTQALKQLLALWEAVPEQAAEMGLSATSYNTSSPRRKIVVLGSEGRVDVRAVGDSYSQSISVLADEAAAQTRIGVHAFGPSGQAALDEFQRTYHAVRGPPDEDVRSGYVSTPPPEDAIHVLVIGRLKELNIEGAYGNASQDISVAAYCNNHQTSENLAGVPAGSPFADRLARHTSTVAEATAAEVAEDNSLRPVEAAFVPSAANSASTGYGTFSNVPSIAPMPQIQVPTTQPWTPPTQNFNPPLVVPTPVFTPPPVYKPPVRFR